MCVYVYLEATPNLPRDYILYVSHIYIWPRATLLTRIPVSYACGKLSYKILNLAEILQLHTVQK